MFDEIKSWADIPETFLLKEYHKYVPIKRRSCFLPVKKNGRPNCVFLGLETMLVVG